MNYLFGVHDNTSSPQSALDSFAGECANSGAKK